MSEIGEVLSDLIEPSPEELIRGREVVLRALDGTEDPMTVTALEDSWLARYEVVRPGTSSPVALSHATDGTLTAPSADDPHIMVRKAQQVVQFALAELLAEGEVLEGRGGHYGFEQESMYYSHSTGSTHAQLRPNRQPWIEPNRRYQLRRPGTPYDELLTVAQMVAGLEELLGARGVGCLVEARRALDRGLFLSCASMTAAASEAAWFTLGRSVYTSLLSRAARDAVDNERDVSAVIEGVCAVAREARAASGTTLNEVRAEAHRMRDIRNYALHPATAADEDRELWSTAPGAMVLLMTARRYFTKLTELQRGLVASAK